MTYVSHGYFASKAENHAGRSRVMISATHNDTRAMIRILLEMWGYDVIEADGKAETVELAKNEHPGLILLDTTQRFADEVKVVSDIRSSDSLSSIPIIVMSARSPLLKRSALEHGATGHLVKPIDLDLLQGCLDKCLDEVH